MQTLLGADDIKKFVRFERVMSILRRCNILAKPKTTPIAAVRRCLSPDLFIRSARSTAGDEEIMFYQYLVSFYSLAG